MKNKTTLRQTSGLRQHMSPQQVRFVRMLEMSGAEIEEYVRNELDENPALEALPEDSHAEAEVADDFSETSAALQAADYASEDDIPTYLLRQSGSGADGALNDFYGSQQRQEFSLMELINSQLDTIDAPERDVALARYVAGYLDNNGRLSRSLTDIADDIAIMTGADISRDDLKPALNILRYEIEPAGLAAFDLRECLLIQLRRRQPKTLYVKAAEEIVADYFDLFTKKHYDRLASALGVDRDTLDKAIDIIKLLDPKPGSSITDSVTDKTAHISPDFFVIHDDKEENRFSISLNQRLPEFAIEESFTVPTNDRESDIFIKRKREEANTFIGLIKRRSDTLLSVMKAIVAIQHRFFETEDKTTLRPMILADISEMTGLDKSVISRATSNKYVATTGGVYPLKMFFNDATLEDNDISSPEIIGRLQQIIDAEDKKHPLSDRALTDALNALGYTLARRTVTKYREKNNIPVARLRKE